MTDQPPEAPLASLVTVVVATRNRRDQLLDALDRLLEGVAREEQPAIVVVDNASSDGTADAVRRRHPAVQVIVLDRNEGAAARNIGAASAGTEIVAFNDDDSWWAPGSLRRAAELFATRPPLGLLAARVLVGEDGRVDPTSAAMAASPLGATARSEPGPRVLGFLACAAAVRRSPFLGVGGFSRALFFAGEEALLSIDLAAAGWELRYHDALVVHHHPQDTGRTPRARTVQQRRNALLTSWLRRPLRIALARTLDAARAARTDPVERAALAALVRCAPTVLEQRRPAPSWLEADLRLLERSRDGAPSAR